MGKAQSKRSVDITTETKKGAEDEITEKMEKIEDLDKKDVVNGDATISEKSDPEKKDSEEVENDKDMTTEKDVDVQAAGDSAEPQNAAETKEEGGSAAAEEISPLADESIKKSKKEKVKKKWSFRSISFGKKDKQKPAKNEDAAEDGSAATNGAEADEKTITEPEDSQKDKSANENEEKTAENHENGNATPQELNGVEPNEEKSSEEKSNDNTANTTNNTTTTETCEPVQNETADVSSELSEKTENTATATTIINEIKLSENATVDDTSKNGNGIDEEKNATEQEPQKTDVTNASVEAPSEKTSTVASVVTNESPASTNGDVVEKIHQNGDHGESEQEVVEKSKAQIEVNSNTDNKVSAATLDYISSTSINPSNVQIHVQDLNASSEMPDEVIQVDNDESSIQKSTDIDVESHTPTAPSSLIEEAVSMVKEVNDEENNVQIETVADSTPETVDTEKLTEDKIGEEPSPPPLPISPPPSQVLVFAFTNNESAVEDSIQTKSPEPSINNVVEEETEEIPPPPTPPQSELNDETESLNSLETNTIQQNVKPDEETTPNKQTSQTAHVDEVNEQVEIQCDEIKEEQEEASACKDMPLHRDDDLPPTTGSIEEFENEEEEASVAAAVIDEITEKAAEIVGEQLKCNGGEQLVDEQSLQSHEVDRQEDDKCNNDEIIKENTAVELDSDEKTNKDQHDDDDDDKESECEVTNCSKESPLVLEQSENITTECSSDFSASNSIQQDQDEKIPLNKSDNLDEEHLNPSKEFANAKDIKDNITVAEITQDLSVTCE